MIKCHEDHEKTAKNVYGFDAIAAAGVAQPWFSLLGSLGVVLNVVVISVGSLQ
jgi:hypothetical protein